MSSSPRRERKLPSRCVSDPLEDERERGEARLFRTLLGSCYGPQGGLKLLRNAVGGPTVATSTSAVLLPALHPPGPVLRLLAAAVRGHLGRRGDGGLFVALLASLLLEGGWGMEVPPGLTGRVQGRLLQLCESYLRSEECACRLRVDLGSLPRLLSLVLTVLGSKPACLLSRRTARHVSTALLRSFLHTVPSSGPARGDGGDDGRPTTVTLGHAVLVSAVGPPVEETRVLPGLLVETPEVAVSVAGGSPGAEGSIRVAVFNTSLSGDVAEGGERELCHEVAVGVSAHGATLAQLLSLGERLLALGVRLLACQKVVHPALCQFMEERGARVLDRLGASLVEPLCRLTGARPLGSLAGVVTPAQLGLVQGTDGVRVGEKRFLHLRGMDAPAPPVCTLVLCHRNDAALAELKLACQAAQHALQALLKEPLALFGGGCTETHLAAYIRHAAMGMSEELLQELRCSRAQVRSVASHLAGALEAVACTLSQGRGTHLVDSRFGHLWVAWRVALPDEDWEAVLQSCACGAVVSPPPGVSWRWLGQRGHRDSTSLGDEATAPTPLLAPPDPPPSLLLDSFTVRSNALQVAVEVASLLLDVKCTIEDTN
uniref:McKusick-Kaufman/Bardet-Biedl syndromes putative chaperonin isoform X1 n=1 Tax=Petromyzon marinus TaxID=7757 RepID=A0AAJ7T1X5_PETMA|nr:McKusick-Kaufman/Bardet-Biedl syndromes putative chaperonin isoform X1 [Petromyzon marinus]